ncbi:MAG: hypothetical protein WCZ87_05990 [Thiohalobacteraceae bacterium]
MKLTQLLTGILVVAGTVAGAAKGYVHYQVKSRVDHLVASAGMFADIRYEGLDTDLSGSATLHGLSILPHQFPDHFRIDAITLSGPDLSFLLNGFADARAKGELPERAAIAIRGWHMRTDSALIGMMQRSSQELAKLLGVESDSCSLGQMFGAKDFAALGYAEFLVDMQVGYRFADSFPGIEVDWDFRVGKEHGGFQLAMTDVSRHVRPGQTNMPRFREMRITYHMDAPLTEKTIAYCADRRAVDRETYITQLGAEPDALYQAYLGFVPGPGLRAAFQELLRNPGEVRLTAQPLEPLDLTTLALYQPAQLPELFGLSLSVNGNPIEDLSFGFMDLAGVLGEGIEEDMENDNFWSDLGLFPSAPRTPATPARRQPAAPSPKYRPVGANDLAQHIGHEVRIVGTGGRKRNGLLKSVERGLATVEERRYGGLLTTTIALDEVVAADAFY